MKFKTLRRIAIFAVALVGWAGNVSAQWNPSAGQWLKTDSDDIRIMTYNVQDGLCATNNKVEGNNNWCALARIVAAMQPDVLLLQETGDNSGNGTGSGLDSVANLTTVLTLFLHGGNDPFLGNSAVTAWVQKYAPAYDLPYIFVSSDNDGFNRNVILSRRPYLDLNGDTKSTYPDIPNVVLDSYAPGGDGGIRGFMFAEIDLPNDVYSGDLVVGCAHLKAGGTASDHLQRTTAARNVAYVVDYWYNGAGTGFPDPNNKISDSPAATSILPAATAVVMGGDWNEDELNNGDKGPTEWLTAANVIGGVDGTDRDRTDMTYDTATNPLNGSRNTQSSSKLDYLAWQDSIVSLRPGHAFVFDSSAMSGANASWLPPEVVGFPGTTGPHQASARASDHKPVIIDLMPIQSVPSVIITEIMYNPSSSEAAPNDVEWIEIHNLGAAPVDLSNWYLQDEDGLTGGMSPGATIAAGGSAVLIPGEQSIVDFQSAWGSGYSIYQLANWSTNLAGLSNDPTSTNEILTIRTSTGQIADVVNFEDAAPWPGDSPEGRSIYLKASALDADLNDDGANWLQSQVGVSGAYGNIVTADFNGADVGSPGFVPDCDVPADCDDGVACTADDCMGGQCSHQTDDAMCDDAAYCNGPETCHINNGCQPGGYPCGAQLCSEDLDACVACLTDADCEDGQLCTDDVCFAGVCTFPHNAIACDDLNWCTDNDACTIGVCTGTLSGRLYADISPPEGDGIVDVDDLVCCLSGFAVFADCPQANVQPCNPDFVIDVDDLLAVLAGFEGDSLCTCAP